MNYLKKMKTGLTKKMSGKTNKRKGSDAERYYAKVFRDLGFTFCKTSRQASRILDDCGVDLTNLPLNVQVKAGKQRGLNPSEIIIWMQERLAENFPQEDDVHNKPNIIIHKKEVGKGKKRKDTDELVIMTFEDFKKIMNYGKSE